MLFLIVLTDLSPAQLFDELKQLIDKKQAKYSQLQRSFGNVHYTNESM